SPSASPSPPAAESALLSEPVQSFTPPRRLSPSPSPTTTPTNSPLPSTPPPLPLIPGDATDLTFVRATAALDYHCEDRLQHGQASHTDAVRTITTELQTQLNNKFAKYEDLRKKYRRLLANRPHDLEQALTFTNTEEAVTRRRLVAASQRQLDTAANVLRRAAEDVEDEKTRMRDEETRLREEEARLRHAEKTKLGDEKTRLRDEKTKLRDEKTRLRDEKTRLRDEKTRIRNEKTRKQRPLFYSVSSSLQEQYQPRPQPAEAQPLTTAVGPLQLSPTGAVTLTALRTTVVDNSTPRILFSDGSLLHSGTADIAMAFGVVDLTLDTPLTVKGRTTGHASSAKAELMGLLAAVVAAPPEQDILIRLDNQSVVEQYCSL
ncbi:hypothetical protein BGX30_007494, partial [Mortierella sp. GBA39]